MLVSRFSPLAILAAAGVAGATAVPCDSANSNCTSKAAPKVILDNDWGTVEFPPFLLALQAGWNVLGLVSDTANTFALQCGLHGLATLEIGGLDRCIPVHKGADWPLINTPKLLNNWEASYGQLPFQGAFKLNSNGSTTTPDDPTNKDPSGLNAVQINKDAFSEGYPNATFASEFGAWYMVEQVRKYPGEVTIYSAGAMTNIALAIRMDSSFAKNAKQHVIMGGYVDLNMQSVAGDHVQADISYDVNLKLDPEAAKIALNADFPNITIVGNAANTVFPDERFVKMINATKTPYSDILVKYLVKQFPIWDSVAAAVMVDPSVVLNTTEAYLDVNVARDSQTYGNIYLFSEQFKPKAQNLQKVRIIDAVDLTKVQDMIASAVTKPPTCQDLAAIRGSN